MTLHVVDDDPDAVARGLARQLADADRDLLARFVRLTRASADLPLDFGLALERSLGRQLRHRRLTEVRTQ